MKGIVVVAIGGNAILNPRGEGTYEEQVRRVDETCREISEIIKKGYQVVVTHGNGPQVGNILFQQEECSHLIPPIPLDVLVAQTQGSIGYMIQQSLANKLREMGIKKEVVTLVTQVVVDERDPTFKNPTKPIGLFYPEEKAKKFLEKGYKLVREKKGWRRLVPSPLPKEIVEIESIKRLVESGVIVIAAGGGGIPVIRYGEGLRGIEAVVDKDLAGEKLAIALKAEVFLILTDIEKVALNYGKENQVDLDFMTVREAEEYLAQGHFGKGSMEPKILAAMGFIKEGGRKAIIASLEKAGDALAGRAGTTIL